MLKGTITRSPHLQFFCKYSLFVLLLVHSAGSLDTQPVVAFPPCSSSECYVSPARSAASANSEAATVKSTDLIVVFKRVRDRHALQESMATRMLQAICSSNRTDFMRYAAEHSMKSSCHMGGLCRHVYRSHILGLAGNFSQEQLADLKRCLPLNFVDYIEEDVKVYKTEGPRPMPRSTPQATPSRSPVHNKLEPKKVAHTSRALLDSKPPSADSRHSGKESASPTAKEQDGSASGPTADSVLIQVQQDFMAGSGQMQQAGLSLAFFATPQKTLTTIAAEYSPEGLAGDRSTTVQAANGPNPVSQGSSAGTLLMDTGVKTQQLHSAQWNLDRLDQARLPLDQKFRFGREGSVGSGRGVTIYTLDSGIRQSHQEFQPWQGSVQRASLGPSFASDSKDASDCDGHGTHIASTAVGRVVGVAKEASLVAVRVLDCKGAGQVSDVVAGLEWVGLNHKLPAVVTMSLGVKAGQWSQTLQASVTNLIQKHGITVVVATGNSQIDACTITPANVNGTIAVAGSDASNKFNPAGPGDQEMIYEYDNTGKCVDVFAPGVDILAACGGAGRCTPLNDSNYAWASGTSMAVPHVAAAAAIYLAHNPNATTAQVSHAIASSSTTGLLNTDDMLPGTPNRLLFVDPDTM